MNEHRLIMMRIVSMGPIMMVLTMDHEDVDEIDSNDEGTVDRS